MRSIAVPGRCRCGRVTFVLREEPIAFYVCHCTDCQAESGSAFGQSMLVRREAIDSLEGPTREHELQTPDGIRCPMTHCTECLTTLFGGRRDLPQILSVNAGSLENSADLEPYGNMWTGSARPWVSLAPGPRYEGQPDDPTALVRAWQERPGAA